MLVAADAEAEQNVGAVDVREAEPLDERPRPREQFDCVANLADVLAGPRLDREEPNFEVRRAGDEDRRARVLDLLERLLAFVRLGQGLGASEHRFDPAALVGRDTVLEEVGVDAELLREPLDRLPRRARLAALDLAHVFLAEPRAREVRLRESRGHAKLANAVAEPGRADGPVGCAGAVRHTRVHEVNLICQQSATRGPRESPKRGMVARNLGEASDMVKSLDSAT